MKVERWTLSSQDALIGVELTATLTDSDGGVPDPRELTGITWTVGNGQRSQSTPLRIQRKALLKRSSPGRRRTPTRRKPATGAMYLRAIAMYTDRTRDAADVDAADNMLFMNTATSAATTAVRNNPDNQAPEFEEDASTFRVVEENTKALAGATGDDAR